MGEQIRSGTPPSEMDESQVATLRAIKRVLVLADFDKGSSAMIAFCDSEEDVRRVDELFNQMSPGDGVASARASTSTRSRSTSRRAAERRSA